MNQIKIDPKRTIGDIDRNIFGGFVEHLGRCIYGGIYEPASPLADNDGRRIDVIAALRRLGLPVIRYPGGNFVSGYHWMDGVGPREKRPVRRELAWDTIETNQFGTDEFIQFCRQLNSEPYIAVNCGDGDMREAADWVEYCNGIEDTSLVRLRHKHGFEEPHKVQYWSIGNEVDGPWQIGYKTPLEYARAFTEFAKVMKLVDPKIKLIAAAVSLWNEGWVERSRLLMEQAPNFIDYMALHWYVTNPYSDFSQYMTLSELFEERLSSYEGLIRATRLERKIERPIAIAVDEWGVWSYTPDQYRRYKAGEIPIRKRHEIVYNLEDALVVAMQLNAFIRHAYSVKMANIAQIVNVLAPICTREDSLVLQTIFYPFELYSRTCGQKALDIWWEGETFAGGKYTGIRTLDVTATLDDYRKQLVVYVVNRSLKEPMETTIQLTSARFAGTIHAFVVNASDIKAENTFASPNVVGTNENTLTVKGQSLVYTFEPHSVTALVCALSRA